MGQRCTCLKHETTVVQAVTKKKLSIVRCPCVLVQDYAGSVHEGYRHLTETSKILLKRTTWQLEIRSRSAFERYRLTSGFEQDLPQGAEAPPLSPLPFGFDITPDRRTVSVPNTTQGRTREVQDLVSRLLLDPLRPSCQRAEAIFSLLLAFCLLPYPQRQHHSTKGHRCNPHKMTRRSASLF